MPVVRVDAADDTIAGLLGRARQEPLILETAEAGDFALLPLDDELLDLLLERSPRLIEECRGIRERMKQGDYLTHEQMLQALVEEPAA